MMTSEKVEARYVRETARHLENVEDYLRDLLVGKWVPVITPLWGLWVIEDTSRHAGFRTISVLCRRMEDFMRSAIPSHQGPELQRDIETMRQGIEYMRQHAGAVALGMEEPPLPESLAEALGMQEYEVNSPQSSPASKTLFDSDGIMAVLSNNIIRIVLPRILSTSHMLSVAWGLRQVYSQSAPGTGWIVDCSALEVLPDSLCGVLGAIQKGLESEGTAFTIIGDQLSVARRIRSFVTGEKTVGRTSGVTSAYSVAQPV